MPTTSEKHYRTWEDSPVAWDSALFTWDDAHWNIYTRSDTETLTAADSHASSGAKKIHQNLVLQDKTHYLSLKQIREIFGIAEDFDVRRVIVRLFEEQFSVQFEQKETEIKKKVTEPMILLGVIGKRHLSHREKEFLSASDKATKKTARYITEQLIMFLEKYLDYQNFIQFCTESLHIGEGTDRDGVFHRAYNETMTLSDETKMSVLHRIVSILEMVDRAYKSAGIVREDGFTTDDTAIKDAFSVQKEKVLADDSMHHKQWFVKTYGEKLTAEDAERIAVATMAFESVLFADMTARTYKAERTFDELFGFSEQLKKVGSILLQDFVETLDRTWKAVQTEQTETLTITDILARYIAYVREAKEKFSVTSDSYRHIGLNPQELFDVFDVIIEHANAVLSNIALFEGDMDLFTFNKRTGMPNGYGIFEDFYVGDHEYKTALIRIILTTKQLNTVPALHGVKMMVDIPDTDDRGIAEIEDTTAATKVYFNRFYYTAPDVSVTLKGGSAAEVAMPSVVSVDNEDENGRYFEVELLNEQGQRVTGTVSWVSIGY